jgi:ribosomal protein S12 methylthiotransferase accessory factor YcaO
MVSTLDTAGVGILVARLVLGPLMFAHGTQKLFGWFGGHGLDGTGGFFEGLGFRPGRTFAAAAGLTEALSGILILLGLLGADRSGAAALGHDRSRHQRPLAARGLCERKRDRGAFTLRHRRRGSRPDGSRAFFS